MEGKVCPHLVYVRDVAFRAVVVALYPDILHAPPTDARGGSTGAERTGEQVLDVLQLQALGLWEAAQDEEEAQHHQASVHEEGPWKSKAVTRQPRQPHQSFERQLALP